MASDIRNLIVNIIFYTIIFLIPTTELAFQVYDLIAHDVDRYWNGILDGEPFGGGRAGGWFYWEIKEKFFGNKILTFDKDLKFLKDDLRRNTVTKDLIHGFNMLVIIVTGGMIWFFEGRVFCNMREFVTQKKGPLMLGALIFFAVSLIPGIIILILIPHSGVDMDGHREHYEKAIKKVAQVFHAARDQEDLENNKEVSLSPESWIRILMQCRLAEGDIATITVEKVLKKLGSVKIDATIKTDLIAREKDHIPFLFLKRSSNLSMTYDISWLRDFGFCPIDPGQYMISMIIEVIMLCILPIIFFGIKLLKLYFPIPDKVEPEGGESGPAPASDDKDTEKKDAEVKPAETAPRPSAEETV